MRQKTTRSMSDRCPGAMDLSAYLDGRGGPKLQKGLENHFAFCPCCRRALLDLREILATPDLPQLSPATARLALELASRLRPRGMEEGAGQACAVHGS